MKPIILLLFILLAIPAAAQDTVTITTDDLRNFRKAAADAVFWENSSKDKDGQIADLQKSVANWKGIAASETDRADRVQGGRVEELRGANTDHKLAIVKLETQAVADRQKIGEQNARIISLESSRKYYAFGGAVAGGLTGFLVGRQTCGTSIPGLSFRTPELRPMPQPQPTFNDFLKQYQR